ncbi:MAG: autotransporter outer membrane beta-barrel domain-containing protein [Rickettsia endosymbiont of Labidopullus appendiculatus]|nr:autotransporter outer membrane beta-barrel domain-containing protein [Rickettsia endosymbiont of Labidopullus appendiculatus]
MDKKSKKSNFLRNLLTTASVASVIVGGSSAAFGFAGAVPRGRITSAANARISATVAGGDNMFREVDAVGVSNPAAFADGPGVADVWGITLGRDNDILTIDAARTIQALNLANHANTSVVIEADLVLGSVVSIGGARTTNFGFNAAHAGNLRLTLNGTGAVAATHGFVAGVDSYASVGTINFAANDPTHTRTLVITPSGGAAANIVFANAEINAANKQNAIVDVTSPAGFNVVFEKASMATARTININNGSTLEFNSRETGALTLQLQQQAGDSINFVGADSKLLLTSKAGGNMANSFQVMNGSLGGAVDGQGIISFNTGAVAGTLSNRDVNGNVVGTGTANRAKQFIVTTTNAAGATNTATIAGKVFTKDIQLAGSAQVITFNKAVYVGNDGKTDIITASTVRFQDNANLGTVDFKNLVSTINVDAGKVLTGTFLGDRTNAANVNGTIHFAGGGTFNGTANKLTLIDITAPGTLKFSGGANSVNQLKATVAGAHFEFDDKYELIGNIDGVAAVLPNLTFGDAKITGNIGHTAAVGNISIKKDKKLTVEGSNAINATRIFDAAGQGTLVLTHKNDHITITSRISEHGGGTIDATGMPEVGKALIIAGDIGTDPANAGSHALEKILLKGQGLTLTPAGFANIAEIDFAKKASIVTFNTINANYALGNLTDAENVTLNIDRDFTLYNTKTKDKLKETKFSGDNTLTLGKDNDITTGITTLNPNEGTLVFAGDSALRGPIGTANKKLKAITVRNDVTATTSGPAFVHEDVTLDGEKSVLIIDSNYIVSKFVGGAADGAGTLRFVNRYPVTLTTTFMHPVVNGQTVRAIFNEIETLELTDGDVKLSAPGGLEFNKIVFTSVAAAPATTATAPTLILDRSLIGIDVDSNFNTTTGGMPTVQLIGQGYNYFSEINSIGKDKDHLVNIKLGDELEVSTKKFFAAVTTTDDGKGKVTFKNEADKVYGLGSEKFKLDTVHLSTNVENFGDTYAKEVVVYGDKTYTAGGTISGGVLRLGNNAFATAMGEIAKRHNNDAALMTPDIAILMGSKVSKVEGGAIASFNDGVTLLDDVTSVGAGNLLNFAGNAVIKGKIGVSGNVFSGMVTFSGAKDRTATLYSDMYVKVVDFGAETLKVAADQLTIGGVSHVNGTIALDSNQLILKDTGTWGTNTNITTTLTRSGKLGKIVLNGAITVAGDVPVTVKITDYASLKDHRSQEYTFIDGYNHLAMADGSVKIDKIIGDVETNQAYSEWKLRVEGSDLIFTRICDEVKGVKKDLDGIGDDIDQQNAKMLAEITGGDAAKYLDDINLIDKAQGGKPKRAESMQRLMNTESAQVTKIIGDTVEHVSKIVNGRLFNVTGQPGVVAAGSDDGSTSMGAWVMPYYSQAVQKNKGGSVGYAVKSGGGVFGFDALANENLTIGAAVSIIKSNMKFKGYKAGEKTAIDTLMLSIYGSQQLAKDFFVQAVASFGSSKVKNTDPRVVSVNTHASGLQTAKASYNSMSYGGELLFGYNAKIDDSVLLTPMAGIRYTRFNGEGYKETGTTSQNKDIRQKASNRVEVIVGARVATTVDTSGITVTPEVHAFVSQKLSGKSGKVDARLDGMTSPFTTRPDKGAKTSFNVGVGVNAKAGVMEYGVGYDAHLASKYVGHQGTLKVRVNF